MVGVGLVALTLLVAAIGVVVAIVRLSDDDPPDPVAAEVLIDDAAFPVALTPTADGGFLYGEKETGTVRRVSAAGVPDPEPVAAFEVNAEGQRGLLGLVEIDGELFASLVRASDDRLVVLRVADGLEVWVGPPSTDLANGGHLLAVDDGRILIGVGDLQDRDARDRDDTVNGKLLVLEPTGSPDQEPKVLSAGWNNPFAITISADGTIWVADNAPGSEPERIGRGDQPAAEASDLDGERAPSALVELPDGRLGVCGFISGTLDAVEVSADVLSAPEAVATPCRTSAAVLLDGRVLTATETQILVSTLPAG
jgi:hypothetical protein